MSELRRIIDRLVDREIDLETAVAEATRMKKTPPESRKGKPRGPRDTYEQVMADPDGGVVHDSYGSILSFAYMQDKIDDVEYQALAEALLSPDGTR